MGQLSKPSAFLQGFVLLCNRVVGFLQSVQCVYAFHFLVLAGSIIGIAVQPTRAYILLVCLWLGIFWSNVFFAGALPRYFLHFVPFSGLFLYNIGAFVWSFVLRRDPILKSNDDFVRSRL